MHSFLKNVTPKFHPPLHNTMENKIDIERDYGHLQLEEERTKKSVSSSVYSEKAALMRKVQISQDEGNVPTMVIYELSNGERLTKSEAIRKAASLIKEQREHFWHEIALAKKVALPLGTISAPPVVEYYQDQFFDNKTLAYLINSKFTLAGKADESVNVANKSDYIQIPTMREYTLSLPMSTTSSNLSDLRLLLSDLDIPYKLLKAKFKDKVIMVKGAPLVQVKFVFPFPDFDVLENRIVPHYNFKFSSIPAFGAFLRSFHKKLLEGKFGDKDETKSAMETYARLCKFQTEHFFGNGTLLGMLSRIRVMQENRSKYNKSRIKRSNDYWDKALRWFRANLGIKEYQAVKLDTLDISRIDEQLASRSNGEVDVFARKVNLQANPGPWYGNTLVDPDASIPVKMKRFNILLVEPIIATKMMIELAKPQLQGSDNPLSKDYFSDKKFLAKFGSCRVVNLFPKPEIYKVAERETKTRCIATYNSACMIPVQQLLQPLQDAMLNAIDHPILWAPHGKKYDPDVLKAHSGTLLLSKQTVYSGVITKVTKLIERSYEWPVGSMWLGLYADNLYVIKRFKRHSVWVSFDGVKAESALTTNDIRFFMKYALVLSKERGKNVVLSAFEKYFLDFFPYFAAEPYALLGNQEILYPAMGSGVNGTWLFNSLKMALLVKGFLEDGSDGFIVLDEEEHKIVFTNASKRIMQECGYSLTIESSEVFAFGSRYYEWPQSLELDLLGFNAFKFHIDESEVIYLPKLRESSLYGLLLFRKEYYDNKGKPKLSTVEEAYYTLIRMTVIVWAGGWHDPALFIMLISFATKAYNLIKNVTKPLLGTTLDEETIREMLFGEFDTGLLSSFSELSSIIHKPMIPTIYEVVKLHTGSKDLAFRAAKSRIGYLPFTYLAPITILEEMSVEPDLINKEVEAPMKLLKKEYPAMKSGAQAYFQKVEMTTGTSLKPEFTGVGISYSNQKTPKPRRVITEDVARPEVTRLTVAKYAKPDLKRVEAIMKWIKVTMVPLGKAPYRVPIPLQYLGLESEIEDEFKVGRKAVVDALINFTGLERDEVKKVVRKMPNQWIVRPLPKAQLGMENTSLFEFDTRPLVPHRVVTRAFVEQ